MLINFSAVRNIATAIALVGSLLAGLLIALSANAKTATQTIKISGDTWQLAIPATYEVELLHQLHGLRMLISVGDGVLLAGSRSGEIHRFKILEDNSVEHETIAELDGYPSSVTLRKGKLFVAKTNGLYQADYSEQTISPKNPALNDTDFIKVAALPAGSGHSSRSVGVGPNGKIYLGIGISGNCSNQYIGPGYPFKQQRGGILVLSEQRGKMSWQPFASGLRNPVGFDWHPETKILYASNHGPDHHGYNQPPEYFSRLDADSFHGMPWFIFNGKTFVRDHCISSKPPQTNPVAPAATFPARNAPMGVTFILQNALEPEWQHDAVVALHGSWATQPNGSYYGRKASRRPPWIARVVFNKGVASKTIKPLITGLQNKAGKRLARPVGVAFSKEDKALYFTSDGGELKGLLRLRKKL